MSSMLQHLLHVHQLAGQPVAEIQQIRIADHSLIVWGVIP